MTNSIEKQKSKKLKLIYTRGLPASGKSTWARKMQSENPGKYKLVSLDDIRETLDQSVFNKDNEKFAKKIQELIIINALSSDYSVIVHNTHLHEKYNTYYDDLVKMFPGWYATVECKDFTHVPLEECIKNDLNRAKSVGERVIRDMHDNFIAKKEEGITQYRKQNPNLPQVVVCDIDNTLALMSDRSPYDYSKVYNDKINIPVRETLLAFINSKSVEKIIFCSGREDSCYQETIRWLNEIVGFSNIKYELFMRQSKNFEKDSIIKRRIFEEKIEPNYFVKVWLDDRKQVIDEIRKLGLPVFEVRPGNF